MIIYRKAVPEDIDVITEMRFEFFSELNYLFAEEEKNNALVNANKKFFTEGIANKSFLLYLAFYNENLVATGGVSFYFLPPNKYNPEGRTAYVSNMYTCPEFRGKGIASEIFSRLISEAKEAGVRKVFLNATDSGRPIYEKFGFKDTKNDMVYYIEK